MRNKVIVLQAIILVSFLIIPFSTALGVSTGTGNLSISLGIDYDSSTIEAFWDNHIIESWNHGTISSMGYDSDGNFSNTTLADDGSSPYYDYSHIPLWDHTPDNMNLAYSDSSVVATFNHSNKSNPQIQSTVHMSTNGVPNPSFKNTSMNDFNYYSEFRATDSGQFTVYLDYIGSWSGMTTSLNDTLSLTGSAQLRITDVLTLDNGFLGYGDELFNDSVYQSGSSAESVVKFRFRQLAKFMI